MPDPASAARLRKNIFMGSLTNQIELKTLFSSIGGLYRFAKRNQIPFQMRLPI